MRLQSSRMLFTLVPVLLVTFFLGVHFIDARPIWNDEWHSISDAGGLSAVPVQLSDVWNTVAVGNPWHPPGFFILLNLWSHFTHTWEPAVLRLMALFFGMLAVAWTYRLGADTISRRVGLYAAVLFGTTIMLTFYLDQIRVYTLLTLLATLTFWLYLRIIRRPRPSTGLLITLLLVSAALLYAHYFGALILGVIGLYHLVFVAKNRRWWLVSGAVIVGMLLFIPWVHVLIEGINRFMSPQEFHDRALTNTALLAILADLYTNGLPVLVLVMVVLAVLAAAARRKGTRPIWFFAAIALAVMLIVNGALKFIPLSRIRYLLLIWPLFSLVAAMGIDWLRSRPRVGRAASYLLLGIWVIAGIANTQNEVLTAGLGGDHTGFAWQIARRVIAPQVRAGDMLVLYWPDTAGEFNPRYLDYYLGFPGTEGVLLQSLAGEQHALGKDQFSRSDRFWVLHDPSRATDPSLAEFQTRMQTQYVSCSAPAEKPNMVVEVYAKTKICCGPPEPAKPVASYSGGQVDMMGFEALPQTTPDKVSISLGWSARPELPPADYSVTLQVFDDASSKVAQKDYGLKFDSYWCAQSDLDVGSLPPGHYDIRAGIYDRKTMARMPGLGADGAQSDLISVGSFDLSS